MKTGSTTLRAGASQRDISPRDPVQLFGYPHVKRISEGIHDPLLASALYVESGEGAILLVVLDLLYLDTPVARRCRETVARALDMPAHAVFIACTHTHSGPVCADNRLLFGSDDPSNVPADPAYLDRIEHEIVAAARAARAAAVPAALAWTRAAITGVGTNRHDPAGTTDPECGILAVRRRSDGSMLGIATIYAMHPTVLHEDSRLVSSDFPHYSRVTLRARFGDNVVVCHHNGPCGNQSPRHVVTGQTFAEAERLGCLFGETVAGAISDLSEQAFEPSAVVRSTLRRIDLPRRALPGVAAARETLDAYRRRHRELIAAGAPRADIRTAECAVFGAEKLVGLAEAKETGLLDAALDGCLPADVQCLRIGCGYLTGWPGECFTEYALALKAALPAVFPVAYVNGTLHGYVVTPDAFLAGGYEAAGSVLSPEAGEILVDEAAAMVREMADVGKGEPVNENGDENG